MINIKSSNKKNRKVIRANKFNMNELYDDLYKRSSENQNFNNIYKYIISEENILLAIANLKANKGSKTSGVDKRNIDNLLELTNDEIIRKVIKKFEYYQPKAVKRVEIPKPNGKKRPLGIPTIMDRLVQQCILQVMEPICEAKFSKNSYGFRPFKSTENAIAQTYNYIQVYNLHYVVNVDIEGFFDNVNHKRLIRQIYNLGIHDNKLLAIIKAMLKAPIQFPNGNRIYPESGTPQGGILSPLLSNIVLNDLDKWIESQWLSFPSRKDYTQRRMRNGKLYIENSNKYVALRKSKLKEMHIVRYADDFKIFTSSEENAKKIYNATTKWLHERLCLNISKEKSGITNLKKKQMEFLGFKIKAIQKHHKYVVKSNISEKAIKKMKSNIKKYMYEWKETDSKTKRWNVLYRYNVAIVGFHNYYSFATRCTDDLKSISYETYNNWKHFAKTAGFSTECKNPNDAKGFMQTKYYKKYQKSSMIRYINSFPLLPLSYISFKPPQLPNNVVNRYTAEGRKAKDDTSGFIQDNLSWLENLKLSEFDNTEYAINRYLKIYNVKGVCEITGTTLDKENIHCHHIIPRKLGGSDKYDNLLIISEEIHQLLHMVDNDKISKMIFKLNLSAYQMRKVNKYRGILSLKKVSKELYK